MLVTSLVRHTMSIRRYPKHLKSLFTVSSIMYVILYHLYQKIASLSDIVEHVDCLHFLCRWKVVKNGVGKTFKGDSKNTNSKCWIRSMLSVKALERPNLTTFWYLFLLTLYTKVNSSCFLLLTFKHVTAY